MAIVFARLNEAITPVIPFIDDVDFIGVTISEHIEVMVHQLELRSSFFKAHCRHCEVLHAYHFGWEFRFTIGEI